jgi:hypothetical protein
LDLDSTIVDIIAELTKLPPALKVWRTPVSDILYDSRLFQSNSVVSLKWKPIIKALFDSDKTSFGELLSMFGIFTYRALPLRLSRSYRYCAIYQHLRQPGERDAGSVSQFTPAVARLVRRGEESFLDSITQRTGEIGRHAAQRSLAHRAERGVPVHPGATLPPLAAQPDQFLAGHLDRTGKYFYVMHRHVHSPTLAVSDFRTNHRGRASRRVRGSPSHSLCEQMPGCTPHAANPRVPNVRPRFRFKDASKALTRVFRHQWMFVTDTVDAVFRPDEWSPEAMFDQLAEIVGSLPIPDARVSAPSPAFLRVELTMSMCGCRSAREQRMGMSRFRPSASHRSRRHSRCGGPF